MLYVLLLGTLFLVHEERHAWISELPVEQNTKEIIRVLVRVFRLDILASEDVDNQFTERRLIHLRTNLVRRGLKRDLLLVLLEPLMLHPFLVLLVIRDNFAPPRLLKGWVVCHTLGQGALV